MTCASCVEKSLSRTPLARSSGPRATKPAPSPPRQPKAGPTPCFRILCSWWKVPRIGHGPHAPSPSKTSPLRPSLKPGRYLPAVLSRTAHKREALTTAPALHRRLNGCILQLAEQQSGGGFAFGQALLAPQFRAVAQEHEGRQAPPIEGVHHGGVAGLVHPEHPNGSTQLQLQAFEQKNGWPCGQAGSPVCRRGPRWAAAPAAWPRRWATREEQ